MRSWSNDQGHHANELWSEVNVVSDKDTAGYVQSQVTVNQPCVGQPLRAFKFNSGIIRKVEVVGQCNVNLSGNLINYRKGLLKKIGEEKLSWLEGWHEPEKMTKEKDFWKANDLVNCYC